MLQLTLSTETLAYLAGYFDGEGTVSVTFGRRAARTPQLAIVVRTGDGACIKAFQEAFGGNIHAHAPRVDQSGIYRKRVIFSWSAHGKKAQEVLTLFMPFLRAKREQAEQVLQMRFNPYGKEVTVEELERRLVVAAIVRDLKKTQTLPSQAN